MDGDVRLLVEQVAQGVADTRRVQEVGGDLVQEGLERVVVVLVDHRDVDGRHVQLPGGADATEATPEHEHVRALVSVEAPVLPSLGDDPIIALRSLRARRDAMGGVRRGRRPDWDEISRMPLAEGLGRRGSISSGR